MSSVRLSYLELHRLKWFLGGCLALLSMSGVWLLDIDGQYLVGLGMLLILGVMAFPHLKMRLPMVRWAWVTPLIALAIVTDFLLSGADLIPPMIRMLVLLTTVRALQFRTRREDQQLVLLSLFLIVITGVITLEITFAFQVLLYVPVAMLTLFTINLSANYVNQPEIPDHAWDIFRWGPFLRRMQGALNGVFVVFMGAFFLSGLAIASIFFLLLPRFELAQTLPFLQRGTERQLTGFSEEVTFGDFNAILEDPRVAMRVDMPEPAPGTDLYWRMTALDEYTGEGFRQSPSAQEAIRHYRDFQFIPPPALQPARESTQAWTIYLEGGTARFLPMPGLFERLRFPRELELERNPTLNLFSLREVPAGAQFYQLQSVEPTAWQLLVDADEHLLRRLDEAEAAPALTPAQQRSYPYTTLDLPLSVEERQALDSQVTHITGGEALDWQTFSQRAIDFLHQNRAYSLNSSLPPGEGDPLLRWLLSDEPGHCELYAGAFILLARAAGHPARMVTGFVGGDWNAYESYLMVRHLHGHAWVEILDPDRGWVRVDPTPGHGGLPGAARAPVPLAVDDTWKAYADSLRLLWYRRVVSFDADTQSALAGGIVATVGQWVQDAKAAVLSAAQTLRSWWERPWDLEKWGAAAVRILLVGGLWWLARHLLRRWNRASSRLWLADKERRQAGKLLRHPAWGKLTPEYLPVRDALQAIRYGREGDWPKPQVTFRAARRYLRRASRA